MLNFCCFIGVLAGCRQDMHDQAKVEPFEASAFFADGRGSRAPVEGTVPRGIAVRDPHLLDGKAADGSLVDALPYPASKAMLERGRERFDIYCAPCHGRTGEGSGMIVRRGYRRPPSLHDDRLVAAPLGRFYDAISNGFGAMPDYSAQIPVADRWAIVAYVRALQASRRATVADAPPEVRARLEGEAR